MQHVSSGVQVVYKPKSLAVQGHFQELLTWLNSRGDHPPFLTLKILDRGNHGWVEFVASRPCTCEEEVRRLYEIREGTWRCCTGSDGFSLREPDCLGEHPVLVDLEALFRLHTLAEAMKNRRMRLPRILVNSVLSVRLLPWRLPSIDGAGGRAERSGRGARPGVALLGWTVGGRQY